MKYDVIVIGAGLAGLTAAARAREKGKSVLLLATGPGTVSISSGCIDLLGYQPGDKVYFTPEPWSAIGTIMDELPRHPYRLVGRDHIQGALELLLKVCRESNNPYLAGRTRARENFLLPTAIGTIKPTYLVPETIAQGDITSGGDVMIVGFKELKDFFPHYLVDNLNATLARFGYPGRYRGVTIELGVSGNRDLTAYDLARLLETEEWREKIARKILSSGKGFTRVGFPATLGLDRPLEVKKDLESRLGCSVFEIPTLPPSVPGLRLYEAFIRYLKKSGVKLLIGYPISKASTRGGQCLSVTAHLPGRDKDFSADAFILATGGLLGGGLVADHMHIRETIFAFPVHQISNHRNWFHSYSLLKGGHPLDSFGLSVDDYLRPISSSGRVIMENVFAAGEILGYYDPYKEKSGGGVALSSGFKAGSLA